MSLSSIIIRTILGLSFLAGGFLLSGKFLPENFFSLPQNLPQSLIGFLCASFGIFILPFLAVKIRDWFVTLVSTAVQTQMARSMAELWRERGLPVISRKDRERILEEKIDEEKQETDKFLPFPSNMILVDTSVLIDGRILDLAKTGFLGEVLWVPSFVLEELQQVADSSDSLKRNRGRRGLEILEELKKENDVEIKVLDHGGTSKDVDKELIKLAKKSKAKILTVDFNLNKVAAVSGVSILNINDLANSVRVVVLPGETVAIKIVQEGKEENQGVGYLEDGTMVVVENGRDLIGKNAKIEVLRIIQTSAGKMLFGRPYPIT